jgi:hypothetical protein
MIVTVTEEPGPVLRVWRAGELLAEVRLAPARALALAEALIAAARRVLPDAKSNAEGTGARPR